MDNINYFKSIYSNELVYYDNIYSHKNYILTLPYSLLANILSYLVKTEDYKNARLVSKQFYNILENFKKFGIGNQVIKTIYFKNHTPYKCDMFKLVINYTGLYKYYLYKTYQFTLWKKNGYEICYNSNGDIKKKSYYNFNRKNGLSIEYYQNKISSRTNYFNNIKHGKEFIFLNEGLIFLEKEYIFGIKTKYKKCIKNKLTMTADFSNNYLDGAVCIYFTYNGVSPADIFSSNIKTKLLFKRNELNGPCYVTQYDRVLKLNYKRGLLDGIQQVFDLDNNLSFIGRFNEGIITGTYSVFLNDIKMEFNENNQYIWTINNQSKIKCKYPYKNTLLNGNYIEKTPDLKEISISYKMGDFSGLFSESFYHCNDNLEIKFLNINNFEYKKYISFNKMIVFRKVFGEYSLFITDLKNRPKSPNTPSKYITYKLINYYKNIPEFYLCSNI